MHVLFDGFDPPGAGHPGRHGGHRLRLFAYERRGTVWTDSGRIPMEV